MNDIDFTSRYQQLVAICRALAHARRGTWIEGIIEAELAIDRKLVEWGELEEPK